MAAEPQNNPQFTWVRVHLPSEIHNKIREAAKASGTTIPSMFIEVVTTFFETEEMFKGIFKVIQPDLEEILVERIAGGTFVIKWQQDSVEKEIIIRGSKYYRLES